MSRIDAPGETVHILSENVDISGVTVWGFRNGLLDGIFNRVLAKLVFYGQTSEGD